ncbi:hypothetical protein [Clostridium formicaceticum]|uniref:CopZ zinc binding domain-containing protein n=1 Tax=Clostridium formicaceticum TaxID=1497 RepID=A0AAC9WF35_9CLOT|nr:hypothetical protein [Clostridium formicaceticum]AOY76042.1 hypothetical protein BJL90_09100 [Clostridium formicaceticum]ARE86401.1 hypothetical protein CLFO_07230 [Clostridium formicaceticum]
MAACGGCNKKSNTQKKKCPLCKKLSGSIHYMAIRPVVKEDLEKFVQKDNYYICNNADCDVVFFNEGEDIIFLTRDINMAANFQEVSKNHTKCNKGCEDCKGG